MRNATQTLTYLQNIARKKKAISVATETTYAVGILTILAAWNYLFIRLFQEEPRVPAPPSYNGLPQSHFLLEQDTVAPTSPTSEEPTVLSNKAMYGFIMGGNIFGSLAWLGFYYLLRSCDVTRPDKTAANKAQNDYLSAKPFLENMAKKEAWLAAASPQQARKKQNRYHNVLRLLNILEACETNQTLSDLDDSENLFHSTFEEQNAQFIRQAIREPLLLLKQQWEEKLMASLTPEEQQAKRNYTQDIATQFQLLLDPTNPIASAMDLKRIMEKKAPYKAVESILETAIKAKAVTRLTESQRTALLALDPSVDVSTILLQPEESLPLTAEQLDVVTQYLADIQKITRGLAPTNQDIQKLKEAVTGITPTRTALATLSLDEILHPDTQEEVLEILVNTRDESDILQKMQSFYTRSVAETGDIGLSHKLFPWQETQLSSLLDAADQTIQQLPTAQASTRLAIVASQLITKTAEENPVSEEKKKELEALIAVAEETKTQSKLFFTSTALQLVTLMQSYLENSPNERKTTRLTKIMQQALASTFPPNVETPDAVVISIEQAPERPSYLRTLFAEGQRTARGWRERTRVRSDSMEIQLLLS